MTDHKLTKQDTHRLHELADTMKKKPMLGFCGAGMSAPLGYPTWGELMEILLDRLEKTSFESIGDVRLTLQAGRASLPHLAQWIKNRMGSADFFDVLNELFINQGLNELSCEYNSLVRLPIRHWMTTNFDNCLSEALRRHLKKNVDQLLGIPFKDLLADRETMSSVTHLHGKISEPTSIVLTSEDYQRSYGEGSAFKYSLRSLAPFSIFFIGYGLKDDELKTCLKATKSCLNLNTGIHYAIVGRLVGQKNFELEMISRELQDLGVRAIFYPIADNDHSNRLWILDNLLQLLDVRKPPKLNVFNLYWKGKVCLKEIRQELAILLSKMPTDSAAVSYCSLKNQKVELSLKSEKEKPFLQDLIDHSSFWHIDQSYRQHDTIAISDGVKTSQISLNDGTVLTDDGLATEEIVNSGKSAKNVSDSPTKIEENDLVRKHDAMLLADAKETLHPSHDQYRDCLHELLPKLPRFGLGDVFHPTIDWRFDSPVINVWIYKIQSDDAGTSEIQSITVIGLGPDFIRQELESHAFGISISMPFDSNSVITRGLIHLSLPQINLPRRQSTGVLSLIGRIVGGRAESHVKTTISDDTKYALTEFARICERISQQTGFIRVHQADYADLQEYQTTLWSQMLLKIKKVSTPIIIKPRAKGKVVKCISHPYYPYPNGKNVEPKIVLRLSGELLEAPSLKRLLKEYYQNVLMKMKADLERRIDFFQREIEGNRKDVDWYRNLSPIKQKDLEDVYVNREIDYNLAVCFQIKGRYVSAQEYYCRNLPNHIIPRQEKELIKLKRQREPLNQLERSQYSSVWKRCLARLFDCAMRQVPLCDDKRLNAMATEWYSHVSGMLNIEWIKKLSQLGVSTQDVFKPTTYFNIEFNEHDDKIEVFPNVVVDSSRTTVIIDKGRRTIVAMDPLDEAIMVPMEMTSEQREDENIRNDEWAKLISSLNIEEKGIDEKVLKMAFDRPDMVDSLCDKVFGNFAIGDVLKDVQSRAFKLAQISSAGLRGMHLLSNGCYHSAHEILNEKGLPGVIAPYRSLFRAYMKCLLEGYDPIDTLRGLREGQSLWIPTDIRTEFEDACQVPEVVERFLDKGELGLDIIAKSPLEETAIDVEYCMEASRLSMQMRSAAEHFDCQNETLGSIFIKAADAIESVHNAILVQAPDQLLQIQRRITGQPLDD